MSDFAAAARAAVGEALARVEVPQERPGTVDAVDDSSVPVQVQVSLDGGGTVYAQALGVAPQPDDRCVVVFFPPHAVFAFGFAPAMVEAQIFTGLSGDTQDGSLGADFTYNSASVTLTDGEWDVQAAATLLNLTTADACSVGLWNNTAGSLVSASTGPAATCTTTAAVGLFSAPVRVTVSGSTVFRPRCIRNGASTLRALSVAAAPAGWIRAVEIL